MKLYRYTVQSNGRYSASTFPTDMLRYDSSWPANSASAQAIDNGLPSVRSAADAEPPKAQRVMLTSIHEPTRERWASFGWVVINVEKIPG